MRELEVMAKPAYVRVAGWLLVAPATIAWALPLSVLREQPLLAGGMMVVVVAVFYGMLAVNLNWPFAQLTAGWGALALAILGVIMVVTSNGLSLLVTVVCLPIAVLLLGPAESRAWFQALRG